METLAFFCEFKINTILLGLYNYFFILLNCQKLLLLRGSRSLTLREGFFLCVLPNKKLRHSILCYCCNGSNKIS